MCGHKQDLRLHIGKCCSVIGWEGSVITVQTQILTKAYITKAKYIKIGNIIVTHKFTVHSKICNLIVTITIKVYQIK